MDLKALNLNRLYYLKILLTEKHVTRAAKSAGLSQPGMSHVLKELRGILKDPLLVRGKQGWMLTEKASGILEKIEIGFKHLEVVLADEMPFLPKSESRHFRIICNDYIGLVLMPALVKEMQVKCPGITLELLPWSYWEMSNEVEKADLVIGSFLNELPKKYFSETLFSEHYMCMVRKNHPRIKSKPDLEVFLKEKHAIVREKDGAIGVVDLELNRLKKKRDVVLQLPSFLVFPFIISQTDLVITTTSRNIALFEQSLPIRAFPNPLNLPSISIQQVWDNRTNNSPAHKWLRGLIRGIATTI